MSKYTKMSEDILQNIGGKDNIEYLVHCITRLRFTFKDRSLVDENAVKGIKGVMGIMEQNGQFQVIVGQEVADIYAEICKLAGIDEEDAIDENLDEQGNKKGFSIKNIFNVISESFAPIIPALAGGGVLKGILIMVSTYQWIATDSGLYILLNAIADAAFYFLPFLLAVSAAKHFKTNVTLSVVMAGVYLHPTIAALANQTLNIFGLDIPMMSYSSSVLPILISVWLLSYVYKFVDQHTHKHLKVVVNPLVTLLVVAPLSLFIIGPVAVYLSTAMGSAFNWLFTNVPVVGGIISGLTRPFVVLSGFHMAMVPIKMANFANYGYDLITPVDACSTIAVGGMCLGAYLKTKNSDNKTNFFSAFVSGFVGITEPGLYSCAFKYRRCLIALMAGSAVAGGLVSALGTKCISYTMPSIICLPAFAGSIVKMLIGLGTAFFLTAALTYFFGVGDEEETE